MPATIITARLPTTPGLTYIIPLSIILTTYRYTFTILTLLIGSTRLTAGKAGRITAATVTTAVRISYFTFGGAVTTRLITRSFTV